MSKKSDIPQYYEDAKSKVKETARSVREELAQHPAPLAPLKNSLDLNIEDLEKPTALYLFREDFAADNKLAFNGKFKGKWTVKLNSILGIGGNVNAPKLELYDEAQINGPIGQNSIQLKFKPAKISGQFDFGHHLAYNKVHVENGQPHNTFLYANPYLYFETDRVFKKELYGLGALINFNRELREDFRLNLRNQEGKFDWDISNNGLIKAKGFFASWFFNFDLKNSLNFSDRRCVLGYDRDGINTNVELNFGKGNYKNWNFNQATISGSYDMRERGTFAAIFTKTFAATDKPATGGDAQAAGQANADAASKAPVAGEDFAIGYRNKLRPDLELKTKMSYKGLCSLFFNYRIREGLNIHSTLQTNIVNKNNKGFLEYPFDFGLKLKLEH